MANALDALDAKSGSVLQDVTLAGTLNFTGGGIVDIAGADLTLADGTINFDDSGDNLIFQGTQTLGISAGDTGAINFAAGSSGASSITDSGAAGTTLTIAAGITIEGGNGSINSGGAAFDNQGIISANAAGNPLNLGGTNWTNDGTIQATSGGSIGLGGSWTNNAPGQIMATNAPISFAGSWTNDGSIQLMGGTAAVSGTGTDDGMLSINGGTANLTGTITLGSNATFSRDSSIPGTVNLTGTLNLAGQTLDSGAGAWILNSGTIKGGTVSNALLTASSTASTLQDVTLAGSLDVTGAGFPTVEVRGAGLTLQGGSIMLEGNEGNLIFNGSQTLAGSGTVTFGSTSGYSNAIADSGAGNTLTIAAGITIHGGNSGSVDTGTATLDNQGTISGDEVGYSLTVSGTNWVNDGTIQGVNGGTVILQSSWTNDAGGQIDPNGGTVKFTGSWSNNGTINVTNGGTLDLGGNLTLASLGTLNRTPLTTGTVALMGTLTLTGQTLDGSTGPWTLSGGTIIGGTVSDSLLTASSTANKLQDVTLAGALTVSNAGFPTIEVLGAGLTLQGGSILLEGNSGGLLFNGSQTLGGSGTITFDNLSGGSASISDSGAGNTLTIAPGITIDGNYGSVDTGTAAFDNQGTINANSTHNGGGLTVNGTNWVNDGTIEGTNGSNIILQGSWTNDATGQIDAPGGTTNLNGTWTNLGTINSTSGTIDLGGTVHSSALGTLAGSGIINFTGKVTNDGTLTLDGSGIGPQYLLSGGTITGGTISTPNGGQLVATLAGGTLDGVTLAGTLLVGQANRAFMDVTDGLTLSNGTVVMEATGFLNFLGTQALSGTGAVDFADNLNLDGYFKGLYVPNAGTTLTIAAGIEVHGVTGFIGSTTGGFVTNDGTIAADGGGTITVQGDTNFAAGTLTGGTWQVTGNSILRLIARSISTNTASILLDGASARVYSDTGTTSALASFTANAAGGSFTIQNGANFTSSQAFTNVGTITIGSGSTFTPGGTGGYTQTGGTTVLNAGTLGATGDQINVQGGALSGPGTVRGNLANAGEVDLGTAPGDIEYKRQLHAVLKRHPEHQGGRHHGRQPVRPGQHLRYGDTGRHAGCVAGQRLRAQRRPVFQRLELRKFGWLL